MLSLMAKDEANQCMVEFWMATYDCCRASPTVVRSTEATRENRSEP
jgi:hypothetical protein